MLRRTGGAGLLSTAPHISSASIHSHACTFSNHTRDLCCADFVSDADVTVRWHVGGNGGFYS